MSIEDLLKKAKQAEEKKDIQDKVEQTFSAREEQIHLNKSIEGAEDRRKQLPEIKGAAIKSLEDLITKYKLEEQELHEIVIARHQFSKMNIEKEEKEKLNLEHYDEHKKRWDKTQETRAEILSAKAKLDKIIEEEKKIAKILEGRHDSGYYEIPSNTEIIESLNKKIEEILGGENNPVLNKIHEEALQEEEKRQSGVKS